MSKFSSCESLKLFGRTEMLLSELQRLDNCARFLNGGTFFISTHSAVPPMSTTLA